MAFNPKRFTFRLQADEDCPSPLTDDLTKVAYLESSRYVLGNEPVSRERMDEIRDGLRSGELIGWPVFAYIHSGVSLQVRSWEGLLPEGHAHFDSGQSGFVYVEAERAAKDWHGAPLTPELRERIAESLKVLLEEFNAWQQGDNWMYELLEDGSVVEAEWGFVGRDNAEAEAKSALDWYVKHAKELHREKVKRTWSERAERRYWACRDVMTGMFPFPSARWGAGKAALV